MTGPTHDLDAAEAARDELSDVLGRLVPAVLDVVEQLRAWAHDGDLVTEHDRNRARTLAAALERLVMAER